MNKMHKIVLFICINIRYSVGKTEYEQDWRVKKEDLSISIIGN